MTSTGSSIRHCEVRYGDHIYGYFPLDGTTTEWFSDRDHEAPHPYKEEAYRRLVGKPLPTKERLDEEGNVFLSDGERDVIAACRFQSEEIADLILRFIHAAREVPGKNKPVGLFYGYLFELGEKRLFEVGSFGYERCLPLPKSNVIQSLVLRLSKTARSECVHGD